MLRDLTSFCQAWRMKSWPQQLPGFAHMSDRTTTFINISEYLRHWDFRSASFIHCTAPYSNKVWRVELLGIPAVGSICRHGLCNRTPGRIELHPTVNRKARPHGMSLVCILLSPGLILPEVSDVNQRFSVLVVDWISAVTLSLMSHGVTGCHMMSRFVCG